MSSLRAVVSGIMKSRQIFVSKSGANPVSVICVEFHIITPSSLSSLSSASAQNGEQLAGAGIYRGYDGYQVMAVGATVELALDLSRLAVWTATR